MASTNKTTNYELSQFIETDRPAWLTDYNGDMRTIDSIMKAISDVASGASGSISELADRMSTAEGNISTNTNDIATLDARADALEAGAQSQAGTIAGIQTEQITQNAGIEAATELGYNLARPYDSASTYAVGAYVLFQNTLYKCITAVSTGEAFDPTKWLAIKATDEIAAGGYTLPTASANTLGGVKVGNGLSIDPITGLLSALDPEITINNGGNTYEPTLLTLNVQQATGATVTLNRCAEYIIGKLYIEKITIILSNLTETTISIPITSSKTIKYGNYNNIYGIPIIQALPLAKMPFVHPNVTYLNIAQDESASLNLSFWITDSSLPSTITQIEYTTWLILPTT